MANDEELLIDLLKTVIDDEGLKNAEVMVKAVSTGGANYSSTLHHITIKSLGKKDLELFAKIACLGEQIRKTLQADELYRNEIFVYQKLAKIYERLQIDNCIPEEERLVFPKFYASGDEYLKETIVLENLALQGYTCHDRFKSINWEYAAKAVEKLAKLHALSYAYAEYDPEEYAKSVAERQSFFSDTNEETDDMLRKTEANAIEAVPEELRMKLKLYFERVSGMGDFKNYYKPLRRPVLVHGDYRCSNLLHKQTGDKVEQLIPVDYQGLHGGSPVSDLIYFIFTGTNGEFRKKYLKQLIDHYYNAFADFIIKLGLDPKALYPRKHFDEDYRSSLPFGFLVSIFILPIVLVETGDAPTLEGEANMSDLAVKPNEVFKTRFLETVNDFMEWGIL